MTQVLVNACPNCSQTPKFLEGLSANALVRYFRCEACGNLWALPKTADAEPRTVVQGRQPSA